MRDVPGLHHFRRLQPAAAPRGMGAACLLALVLATGLVPIAGSPPTAGAHAPSSAAAGRASHARVAATRRRHARVPFSRTRPRRAELRRQALKRPTLTLKSSFIQRAAAADLMLPFTLRLRRPYEGGPGDDVLQLAWDTGAVPWPLGGTVPPAAPAATNLDGGLTYEWDYGADTTGYSQAGTVETVIGGGISLTAGGFPIAQQDGEACTSMQSLASTGMALTSAGARFGIVNPFSGQVNGTINLRTAIRTEATPCDGSTPASAVAETTGNEPPLPVAFTGRLTVSPGVSSDGRMRLGILRIDDTTMPQRTTFGLIHVCTDPTAPDGCARQAFPVRTKLLSLTAEVLAGDVMPPPPAIPAPSSTTPASTTSPSSTDTSTTSVVQ
jgi:hypothetical protein